MLREERIIGRQPRPLWDEEFSTWWTSFRMCRGHGLQKTKSQGHVSYRSCVPRRRGNLSLSDTLSSIARTTHEVRAVSAGSKDVDCRGRANGSRGMNSYGFGYARMLLAYGNFWSSAVST